MSMTCIGKPAGRAYVVEAARFHGHLKCPYNECAHCRWQPCGGESRGLYVCALRQDPTLGEGMFGQAETTEQDARMCMDYEPNKNHRYHSLNSRPAHSRRGRCSYDYGSYSGYSGIDELGLDYSDFGIPVWGS